MIVSHISCIFHLHFSMATYESVIDVNDQQEDAVEVPLGGEGDVEKENNKNSRL